MTNLLCGDFYRTFKSKYFFLLLILSIAVGFAFMVILVNFLMAIDGAKLNYSLYLLVQFYILPFYLSLVLGVACVYCAGSDFDGGMIRNKIVAGYTKTQIFIAKSICNFVIMFIDAVACMVVATIVFIAMVGGNVFWEGISNPALLRITFIGILQALLYMMFVSVFVSGVTFNTEKTITALVIVLALMFSVSIFSENTMLYATSKEQYWHDYNEETGEYHDELNSFYLPDGTPEKTFYIIADSANVLYRSDCFIRTYDQEDPSLEDSEQIYVRYLIGDLVMTLIVGTVGLELFKRRNTM